MDTYSGIFINLYVLRFFLTNVKLQDLRVLMYLYVVLLLISSLSAISDVE